MHPYSSALWYLVDVPELWNAAGAGLYAVGETFGDELGRALTEEGYAPDWRRVGRSGLGAAAFAYLNGLVQSAVIPKRYKAEVRDDLKDVEELHDQFLQALADPNATQEEISELARRTVDMKNWTLRRLDEFGLTDSSEEIGVGTAVGTVLGGGQALMEGEINAIQTRLDGKTIGISRIGLDKFLSGDVPYEKYASGFHIPELVESAHKVGEAGNYHKKTIRDIPTYEYFDSPIEIDGKLYSAHIRVKNTNMGDKYYGHTISEVDHIEIEAPTRSSVPLKEAAYPAAISDSTQDIHQLLSKGVQFPQLLADDILARQSITDPRQNVNGAEIKNPIVLPYLPNSVRPYSDIARDYAAVPQLPSDRRQPQGYADALEELICEGKVLLPAQRRILEEWNKRFPEMQMTEEEVDHSY